MKAPGVWPLTMTFAAVVFLTSLFVFFLFREDNPALSLFVMDTVIFVVTAIFATIYWRTLVAQFRILGFNKPAAWLCLTLLVPALLVNFGISLMFQYLLQDMEIPDYLQEIRDSGVSEATLIFSFCVLPAVTEEIAFRGLVQHWLHLALRPWRAILLASAIFAGIHFDVVFFPYFLGVGVLLGYSKWKTGSLYPAMLIHFLHNLVVIELFP